jgi:hypothetical protein
MRNNQLLESKLNTTFESLLVMTPEEFRQWAIDLRQLIVFLWDKKGLPPQVGYDESEIISGFKKMLSYPVHEFETIDELTGEKDVIRNTSNFSAFVNSWFPTMMKTKISYSSKGNARSIYDYFADPDLLDSFVKYASRHFKRDSFYHYSAPISEGDKIAIGNFNYVVGTAADFISWFENMIRGKYEYDYWLCPIKENKAYSGYNQKLLKKKNLVVDADFTDTLPENSKTNVNKTISNTYVIRLYKRGQKIFPIGLKAFRISFSQMAVNFPPLTARYLYERNH